MIRSLSFLTTAFALSLVVQPLNAQQEVEGEVVRATEATTESSSEASSENSNASLDFLNQGVAPTSVSQLRAMEKHVAELAERCKPAIVNIRVGEGQGSGVVVDRYGTILTAAHVIGGPGRVATVTFPDGKEVKADTLGINRRLDSGMLKIIDKGRFPYLDTGESELLNLGQWVLAIGHPGGIDRDRGLVVRVGRLLFSDESVLRTDCTLVGGDSGGPLIDMDGNVIGIHSRIGGSLTNNIHVPVDGFSREWDDLLASKRVGEKPRPYIGFRIRNETNEIEEVKKNSPAEKAGLQKGDVIIKVNNRKVNDADSLRSRLKLKIGDKVKLTVQRDDDEKTFELTIGQQ